MRIASPDHLLSWTFTLRDSPEGPALATVAMKTLKVKGTITVDGVAYGFEQTDFLGKRIVLTFEGVELAVAERTSMWTQKTRITFAAGGLPGSALRLVPLGVFQVGFSVQEEDGAPIGRVERKGLFKSAFQVRLPDAMPLPLQGFLVALAMVDQRRRQNS
jgi:hypothetical protein